MKICVVGVGGIGGYFGGRLIQAGFDVTLIARGQHAEALKTHGLKLLSIEGDAHLPSVKVCENPQGEAPYDLILICVKTWQVPGAAKSLQGTLAENGVVIPLQNGVEAAEQLSTQLGNSNTLSGLCGLVSFVKEPGVIQHVGIEPFIMIGELAGSPTSRVKSLAEELNRVDGMSVSVPTDMQVALWEKFLFIVAMSGIGSITKAPIGISRQNNETRQMLTQCITEAYLVGKSLGVPLAEDSVQTTIKRIDKAPPDATASMQRDILNGRPSELFAQNGAVDRMGKERGIPTPVNSFITASLTLTENRSRGVIDF